MLDIHSFVVVKDVSKILHIIFICGDGTTDLIVESIHGKDAM